MYVLSHCLIDRRHFSFFLERRSFARGKSDQGLFIITTDIYVTRYGHMFVGSVHRNDHEGPDTQQRYSSTLSLTSAVDGGG